jgi:hypothetical protein
VRKLRSLTIAHIPANAFVDPHSPTVSSALGPGEGTGALVARCWMIERRRSARWAGALILRFPVRGHRSEAERVRPHAGVVRARREKVAGRILHIGTRYRGGIEKRNGPSGEYGRIRCCRRGVGHIGA